VTRPLLVVIAGPNGSGKSTLTDDGNLEQLGLALPKNYINPDDIRREIVAERPDLDGKPADQQAFRRARELREEYRSGGLSFAFETVFSHPSNLVKFGPIVIDADFFQDTPVYRTMPRDGEASPAKTPANLQEQV